MIVTRKALPRRTFVRGVGVALGLPLLDAMVPALSAMSRTAATPVRRFAAVYAPNGMSMQHWTPPDEGTAFTLSPTLTALAPFRDHLTVVSGLNGPLGANHAGGSTGFLTGVPNDAFNGREKSLVTAGPSIDQIVAKELGEQTHLASLAVALDEATGACDGNVSCIYTNTISWRTATTPMFMEINPRAVFEQLFGDTDTTNRAARSARLKKDKSIVDAIVQEINDLTRGVGPGDRRKITEFVDAVRDVERRIQIAEAQGSRQMPAVDRPGGIPETFKDHAELMFALQYLAFQADLTRVTTFMFGREISNRPYPEIGVPEAHHAISHHLNDREKIAGLAKINAFHVSLFAGYLEKLRSTPDGDGSLLDHLIILYGSGLSDSNTHIHSNLPLLLVGGGAGRLKGNRHLKYAGDPSPNLLLTIADKLGVPIDALGISTGKLNSDPLNGI